MFYAQHPRYTTAHFASGFYDFNAHAQLLITTNLSDAILHTLHLSAYHILCFNKHFTHRDVPHILINFNCFSRRKISFECTSHVLYGH